MPPSVEPLDARVYYAAAPPAPSYADNGTTVVDFRVPKGQRVNARQAVVDHRGRTYVVAALADNAGAAPTAFQIARLAADGTQDDSWAVRRHGRLKYDWADHLWTPTDDALSRTSWEAAGFRVAVDSADRLVVLNGTTLTRFTVAGDMDPTFGAGGTVTLTNFRHASDFAITPDDRIVVAGTVPRAHLARMAVTRLKTDGAVDKQFGRAGVFAAPAFGGVAPFGRREDGTYEAESYGRFLRVLDDGGIVVAGEGTLTFRADDPDAAYDNYEFDAVQVVRLTARGRFDRGYGTGGVAESFGSAGSTGLQEANEHYSGVAGIRPDGAVVMETFRSDFRGDHDVTSDTNTLIRADSHGGVADDDELDLSPTNGDRGNGVGHVEFVGPAAGPFVTSVAGVDGYQIFRQSARGKFDPAFGTQTSESATAIAQGPGGTVVVVKGGGEPDRLSVDRLLPA